MRIIVAEAGNRLDRMNRRTRILIPLKKTVRRALPGFFPKHPSRLWP